MAYNPNAVFISPSSLSDFEKCPQLYYYKAVYRAPSGLKIQIINPAIALGQVVHEAINQLINLPVVQRSKDRLLDIYEFLWKTITGEKGGFINDETEYKSRGLEMLERFWANGHFREAEMVPLPSFPKVDLGNNLILTGKLDWIERDGETYHVIDFKTGKNEEKAESMQLPIYAVLACGILKTFDIRTSYWYLDREDSLTSFPLPDINETTRTLVTKGEIIQKARKENSFKCQSGRENCYACRDIQAIAKGHGKLVAVDTTNYKQEIYILPSTHNLIPF
ncbi:MAG: PD-(D/E)XK nuclease family protein [Patescibacteria group bacterium]